MLGGRGEDGLGSGRRGGSGTRELLLGLRYYSSDGRYVLAPEKLPVRVLELALAAFLLTLVLFFSCDEAAKWTMPSITHAGAIWPSSIPYTLGLHVAAVLLAATFWCLHATQAKKLSWNSARRMPDEYHQAKVWAHRCLWVGLAFCLLLAAVGSVSVEDAYAAHFALACALFFSGALYAALLVGCVLRTAKKLFVASEDDERDYRLKAWLAAALLALALAYTVALAVGRLALPDYECDWPEYCPARAVRSGIQYAAAGCLLLFFRSLRHDLQGVQMELLL